MSRPDLNANMQSESNEILILSGGFSLATFVNFVKKRSSSENSIKEATLLPIWRQARREHDALKTSESTLAEHGELLPLSRSMASMARKATKQPIFQRSYSSIPVGFGLVEIDALIALQNHVDLTHTKELSDRLGSKPTDKDIFDFCVPTTDYKPKLTIHKSGTDRYVIQAESEDLRYLGSQIIDPNGKIDVESDGDVARVIGLLIGYGSPCINVVRHGTRMVLNNGYHRTYALRQLGFKYIPCVIQAIDHPEELAFAGGSELIEDYVDLFQNMRPPLFKDFFNQALTYRIDALRSKTQIQISIDVDSVRVAV